MIIQRLSLLCLAAMACSLGVCAAQVDVMKVTTFYVNNVTGSDQYDGLSADKSGESGPCATIMGALQKATVGAQISIANTGVDYREFVNITSFNKGRPSTPLVIDGHGAAVSGLVQVPAFHWMLLKDDIYWFENSKGKDALGNPGWMPNSNWLGFTKHQGWFDQPQAPQIFFFNGMVAPSVTSLAAIPPGGFFYDTLASPRRLYFRLPPNTTLADCAIDVPLNAGVFLVDSYITIRNLVSHYSVDDGFWGYWGVGEVLENVNGSYNCDQGSSFHGTSGVTVDGGLFEHNGGCGIVDVESSVSVYSNCIVRDNAIGGVLFDGLGHALLNCNIYGNEHVQVEVNADASLNIRNCLVVGAGTQDPQAIGVRLLKGRGRIEHCTITNCATGIQAFENATIKNSIIACCVTLIDIKKDALPKFAISKTLLAPGTVQLGDAVYAPEKLGELAQAPQVKDLMFDTPKLERPNYLLSKESPYYKAAEYGQVLGAVLPDHIGNAD
jgi:hypothetical protein